MDAAGLVVGVDGDGHEDVLHRRVGRVAVVGRLVPAHRHAAVAHEVGQLHEAVGLEAAVPLGPPVLDLLGEGAVVQVRVVVGVGLTCGGKFKSDHFSRNAISESFILC